MNWSCRINGVAAGCGRPGKNFPEEVAFKLGLEKMSSSDWTKACLAEGTAWASALGQARGECVEGIIHCPVWLRCRVWASSRLGYKEGAGAG